MMLPNQISGKLNVCCLFIAMEVKDTAIRDFVFTNDNWISPSNSSVQPLADPLPDSLCCSDTTLGLKCWEARSSTVMGEG